ncbi:putative nicotinate-nucleotide adenylyltransferase [Chelatococcus reniformis]|uniref:Probable nicotinate-nucleotide adenylyltransferase n=2 Tax=Chelatococcus reniformis TaxID=1494448 RepID=A0A916TXN4_9HYPH|nr:putative nicotinate-nucleotide adenylyltransferase [Chelatococcus reniformis]
MNIGLFGGSFNPPHAGHRLVATAALKRLGLHRVWWLVTPGNPLKNNSELPALATRLAAARRLARHPRVSVTGFEAEIGARYTYDTVAYLKRRCPEVRFVWLMGADSFANFHRWQNWRRMAALIPIAVIDRPGLTIAAARSRAATALARYRLPEEEAHLLAGRPPPAWIFLHGPRSPLSSTALRRGAEPGGDASR